MRCTQQLAVEAVGPAMEAATEILDLCLQAQRQTWLPPERLVVALLDFLPDMLQRSMVFLLVLTRYLYQLG